MSFAATVSTLYFPGGVLIGLASAAPVGPVNLLVIQRTLTTRMSAGLLLGTGGAVGDALFAAAAAFGLGAVARLIAAHGPALRLGGGAVMLAFAVAVWRSTPRLHEEQATASALRMSLAALVLTLTNPATLLFFVGAFGAFGFVGIGHNSPEHRLNAGLVVAGSFTGSMLWWLTVSGGAHWLRGRITDRHLLRLNRATAGALALFGGAAIATGLAQR